MDIYFKEGKSPEAIEGLRGVLRSTMTENAELAALLRDPELAVLHERLKKLTDEPTDGVDDNKVINLPLFPTLTLTLTLPLNLTLALTLT